MILKQQLRAYLPINHLNFLIFCVLFRQQVTKFSVPLIKKPEEKKMPEFSTLRLVFINAMVCGLEVAATVAFTYLPPILLKAGFAESSMGIILGVGIKYSVL